MNEKWIVILQGKEYPTYPGVLAEAHERGLQSITTEVVQIPDEGNGHTAIVRATVVLKDGSVFSDYGDASPRNVNAKIATALLRMASTRAKGRALRDAVNIGATLAEELPDLDEPRGDRYAREMPTSKFGAPPAPIAGAPAQPPNRPIARYEPGTPEGDAAMAGRPARSPQSGFAMAGDVQVANCSICHKPLTVAQVTFCAAQQPPICPPAHMACLRGGS